MKNENNFTKLAKLGISIYLAIAVVFSVIALIISNNSSITKRTISFKTNDPEITRAMTYDQFEQGSEDVYSTDGETKVDNIKFSAFFLRDLDGDGDAETVKRKL